MKVQVIEKKKGRINRTTGEEIKGNLRVCAYARVSTEKEEQINSITVWHCMEFVKRRKTNFKRKDRQTN